MKNIMLICVQLFWGSLAIAQSLAVYPAPQNNFSKTSDVFLVNVTQKNIKRASFVYEVKADSSNGPELGNQKGKRFHFTNFSFSCAVTVEVTKLNSQAKSAIIRPTRLGIVPVVTDVNGNKKVKFKLSGPAKVSVEFSDDSLFNDALMIFANQPENAADIPANSTGSKVYNVTAGSGVADVSADYDKVYFGPGVYDIGQWVIPANISQVYIAGGAYVKGYLYRSVAVPLKINGRGIITNDGYPYHYPAKKEDDNGDSRKWYSPVMFEKGGNHVLEGITIVEATAFNVRIWGDNTTVQNVKIHGFRYNNDGINIVGNNNKITDCFISANDDAIVPYCSNLMVSDCVIWQLQGSTFQLGWTPHSANNITINNIDILHDNARNSEGNVGFINAMNDRKTDQFAIVKDVKVSNIYFDTPVMRFLDIRGDRKYNSGQLVSGNWLYKNFTFNNIRFKQGNQKSPLVYLHGANNQTPISNFIFRNIYINNKLTPPQWLNDKKNIDTKNFTDLSTN